MNPITQFLSGLTFSRYLLLYFACFVLATAGAWIGVKTKLSVLQVLMPISGLLGGMLAVGYVTVKMEAEIGLGILAVWAAFSSIIIFPALWLSRKAEAGKVREKTNAEICAEKGHDWQTTEQEDTLRCSRCGKIKSKRTGKRS